MRPFGAVTTVGLGLCLSFGCTAGDVEEKQPVPQEAAGGAEGFRTTFYYRNLGRQAMQQHDYPAAKSALTRALASAPAHPAILYMLARVEALQGEQEASLASLQRLADMGATADPTSEDAFSELSGLPGVAAISAQLAANGQPQPLAEVVTTFDDAQLWSEGIAFDPVAGDLYIGSIKRKKIIRMRPDGSVEELGSSATDGLLGLLGMEVDSSRRHLWACTGDGSDELFTDGERRQNAVVQYDLETEQLIAVYPLADDGRNRLVNDLAITPDGTVYVTESNHGTLYTIAPGDNELRLYRDLPDFNYLNGITISNDGNLLYVAAVEGIIAIDLASGEVHRLEHGDEVSTVSADGLEAYGNSLIAVQNHAMLGFRVARFFLDATGLRVERQEVLPAGLPEGLIPYTCAIGDGVVYVNGTSTFDLYDRGEIPANPVVVRIELE